MRSGDELRPATSGATTASLLEGKVAIVTGAGQGIGRATAELLSDAGAAVVVNDLDAELAAAAERELPRALAVPGDVTDVEVVDALVAGAVDGFGHLDIVVNNAGYNRNALVERMTDHEWQQMLEVHATAPFRLLRAVAPHFIEAARRDREQGSETFRKVVNVSSVAIMGSAGQANYAAAKAAVVGLTKSLAKEWGAHRVNVNAVSFGSVDTRLTHRRSEDNSIETSDGTVQLGLSEKVIAAVAEGIVLGRPATPGEAAGGIFLLCTPWSDWITGQVINVNGGQVFGMSS